MKILWIANTIFPAPSVELGLPVPVIGGWMYGLAEQLIADKRIKLAVASVYSGEMMQKFIINDIEYYMLPYSMASGRPEDCNTVWDSIYKNFMPDIVHIHGTELKHGLSCMHACCYARFIVSIQGLVSVYAEYFYAGMSFMDILKNITVRDVLRLDTIFNGKSTDAKRGVCEVEYIQKSTKIIGRTSWDYAHVKAINANVEYEFCNEILRAFL